MKINVKVGYKYKDIIYIEIGGKTKDIITDDNKEINASDIYNLFNYKSVKEYVLKEKENEDNVPEEYRLYLEEVFDMIEKIVEKINKK